MYSILFLFLAIRSAWCSPLLTAPNSAPRADFEFLVLAQFWPQASCVYFEDRGQKCDLPSDVRGWTIHGFWPSNPDESPQFCNDSMPFKYSMIESLRPQLDQYWHYYNASADQTELWEHEWDKHGTCAYQLESLRGELKYFSQTLRLHSGLQTSQAFIKAGIQPSFSISYQRDDYFKALLDYYKKIPNVVCEYDEELKKHLISQVYLCFDLNLELTNCSHVQHSSSHFDGCPEKEEVYYLPFNTEMTEVWESVLIFRSETEN